MTLQQEAHNKSSSESSSLSRKVHKADREKLRRDKLNEQFAELAAILDPEKPKLDKASILGDSLQAVRDLRNEIKRLRMERGTLFDESRDLRREKCDLEEEKAVLQKQTDELEVQLHQMLKAAMTPSTNVNLSNNSFAEPVSAPPPPPPPPPHHQQAQLQHPFLGYVPGLMSMSSNLSNPFVYLTTPSVHRVERPSAQYATPDSVQDFLGKVQQQQQQQRQNKELQPHESQQGFQPPAYRSSRAGDQLPGGCSSDESDTQLHLGQCPASAAGDDKAFEVDTDLQLKVAASSSKTTAEAHAGA